ncbi:uncharacterized protein LOC125955492, partial [Anopheles darlingi]|uniref:uncharacterized protein LOC125955492 n=1 Tax=Anopheles darlingi TaxID=43151 RepID=UPI002100284B
RLAKLLGVTDFEHLPPFEDVKALLGTATAGETIKAIKEYASTPDGLELIKDYVMSYQPAKRISLGKDPYSENEIDTAPLSPTTSSSGQSESGFFAHLRRLRSFLTFGYYGASETAQEEANVGTTVPTTIPTTHSESSTNIPLEHYIIPIHPLPSKPNEPMEASAMIPYPPTFFYPVVSPLQTTNPIFGNENLSATAEAHDSNAPITVTDLPVIQDNLIEIKGIIPNSVNQGNQEATDQLTIKDKLIRGPEASQEENNNQTGVEISNSNVQQSNNTEQDDNVPSL